MSTHRLYYVQAFIKNFFYYFEFRYQKFNVQNFNGKREWEYPNEELILPEELLVFLNMIHNHDQ